MSVADLPPGHPDRILLEGYEMAVRMGVRMGEMPDLEAAVAAVKGRAVHLFDAESSVETLTGREPSGPCSVWAVEREKA